MSLDRNEYEYEFIVKIVQEVSNKIYRGPLHIADYPVGLESRLLQLMSHLDVEYDHGIQMLGICGIGGLAKHDLEQLQEKILSKIVDLDIKIGDVSEGIPLIKQRLQRKKVLLILDNVDKLKQLQVMAEGLDWFGSGNIVIITTRDQHLLVSHGIYKKYQVHALSKKESLELLNWKPFKHTTVASSYDDILDHAIAYASGLPLVLEVLGPNLFGKNIEEWKSILHRYERIPNKEIQKILKVSFDALEEDEQGVFLDIPCCFKGYDLREAKDILCAHHGQCIDYLIGVLVEKNLIKIIHLDSHVTVTLYHLVEDICK
ncbi:hypothetical protein KIW84_013330 [Lathyrus oleraceus]|uniref:NBS-LRR type disease resistance protein n=1 Tax=Pisum sativum TaxID=3888 RepID=A0A9D5BK26_PEA|nr:hypothetical protein KIW84_013330 [Pisum sativum]